MTIFYSAFLNMMNHKRTKTTINVITISKEKFKIKKKQDKKKKIEQTL